MYDIWTKAKQCGKKVGGWNMKNGRCRKEDRKLKIGNNTSWTEDKRPEDGRCRMEDRRFKEDKERKKD